MSMFSLGMYLAFMSKIGLTLSIICLETLAAFHPASLQFQVLYGSPYSLLIPFGSSNEIRTTYFGLCMGSTDIKVVNFSLV